MKYDNPLIVQGDRTILLDVHSPLAEECRNALIPFSELERSPEHLHTYRLSPLSLWNAASAGFSADDAIKVLEKYSRFDVPQSVNMWIKEVSERFGKLILLPYENDKDHIEKKYSNETKTYNEKKLIGDTPLSKNKTTGNNSLLISHNLTGDNSSATPVSTISSGDSSPSPAILPVSSGDCPLPPPQDQYLVLQAASIPVYKEIAANRSVRKYITPMTNSGELKFLLKLTDRGTIKQLLLQAGWPVKDQVALTDGEPLEVSLRETTSSGIPLKIREYQLNSAKALVGDKGPGTGFGTIVLPCGAGKTIVGMTIMDMLKTSTLIITTNISAVHQWIDELVDKTTLTRDEIAEYSGESKVIKPVTVATYQVLTWRPDKDGPYPHFSIFHERKWGLIIYDEVHMLPAPVFRVVAELQAVRRVGLTATLVREDGCEGYVFSLVGPKRYDVPWKELERNKWIATAECIEVRIDLPTYKEIDYAVATAREKHKIASQNPDKIKIVQQIINKYPEDKILVIGQYLEQLTEIAEILKCPIITGKTHTSERDKLYADFKSGVVRILVVSKVANFAIDLPDASLAIQVSGTFGSRQEEAQRLGRILRPKERTSRFFTLITRNTVEEEFGSNRQKFLAEQGYSYKIIRYSKEDDLGE